LPALIHLDERREGFAVSLTILYRNRERPDEASMTMIADRTVTTAVIGQLEKRGFVVDKISFAEPRTRNPTAATAPPQRLIDIVKIHNIASEDQTHATRLRSR
jgi:hypothetical protein